MTEKKRKPLSERFADRLVTGIVPAPIRKAIEAELDKNMPQSLRAEAPAGPMRLMIRDEARKAVRGELGLSAPEGAGESPDTAIVESVREEARRSVRAALGTAAPEAETGEDTPVRQMIREEVKRAIGEEMDPERRKDAEPAAPAPAGRGHRKKIIAGGVAVAGVALAVALSVDRSYVPPTAASDMNYTQTDGISPRMVVAAAAVGAADGMRMTGWKDPIMQARVNEVGKMVPKTTDDPAFAGTDKRLVRVILDVRTFAKQDAIGGSWNEDALEGYLQVAEMSEAEYVSASAPFVQETSGLGIDTVIRYEDVAKNLGDSVFLKIVPEGKYANLAFSKAIAFESAVIQTLVPALTERGTKDLPEMGELRTLAGQSTQHDVDAVASRVLSAGFNIPLEMSMRSSGLEKVSLFPDAPKRDEDDEPSPM